MKTKSKKTKAHCGLCGKTKRLIQTDCCGNWICDDEGNYVLFSYARNSCSRNHRRFTLCAAHQTEGHKGDWKACKRCLASFDTEMYVWYGTNQYNFEMLLNPPAFKPTRCSKCEKIIKLATDGYTRSGNEIWCERCAAKNRMTQGALSS